ncbi:FAD-binding and (Fe-S)-binding domain-containing protein [Isoptericola sp. b490]|uniref:FAD-binding and (Fe-S)-binding domain-containing protein n=1 Tax=Actinotalea lenta TaxID=3064654 RepID=UPI002712BC7E|nr:FAD-binding and (Fe-S)-binding domain-containing protein [Isoptericola sp. b490]MDO8121720.1 FAD-binding and (Fe-S)-binding domain-containing protein [Isoptericola sp. b490]
MPTPDPAALDAPTVPEPELLDLLRREVRGEVDTSTLRRALYSSDASNYRVVPQVVVVPRDVDDLLAVHEVARATRTPLTVRGGGTSVAGNAVGPGIVVDTSVHLRAVTVDAESRTATVEPGVVMSDLQAAAAPYGLRFGPDPSTQNRATLGGMIGNNACGPHAVAYGRTADNVVSLDVVDGRGRRFTAGAGVGALDPVLGLAELVDSHLGLIRTELGRFGRQVSGYSLEHLLPEHGTHLGRMLVGTEGTLVTVLGATVDLVPVADAAVVVVLGYPDMATAADAVPALLAHQPLAVEGLDARLVEVVRRHQGAVPELPPGAGWLMVEMGGTTPAEALERARAAAADARTTAVRVLPPGPEASAMWRIRADGAGLAGRTPSGAQAWPGWEDAAVPPERLGEYLRAFEALMARHGVDGLPYGHFGDGCVHVRLDLPLTSTDDVPGFRAFLEESAELVVAHGGSLSGEHGDGRARSELLTTMYSEQAIALFAAVKDLFDPADVLNPGVVVRPAPVDGELRRPHAAPLPRRSGFAFAHDGGDLTTAVHRCVGVGKCRADTSATGGFMCPSYLATRDEKDSTRGRARVLQEMANGALVTTGWRAPEVREVLDLCLSCKACSADCPAGVDMAAYKAEVLHRAYRRRRRPMNHYALGWLPRWTRLVDRLRLAPLANLLLGVRPLGRAVLRLGGMDQRRTIPRFATTSFRRGWRADRDAQSGGRPVVLWADSFSDGFDPDVPQAMVDVLQAAGYRVIVPEQDACCGLTWISTGQLDGARRRLSHLLEVLGPFAVNGVPIVGVEPSCTAVLRSDLLELVPQDPRAAAVAAATRTLSELLTADEEWTAPRLDGLQVVAQPHCHQHSVMGYEADLALLAATGAQVTTVAGCCGLAGNFGMEKGHYEVSVAVAEHALLPALRDAPEGAVLLADGFSCRTQAEQLGGVRGVHLAQLLRGAGAVSQPQP